MKALTISCLACAFFFAACDDNRHIPTIPCEWDSHCPVDMYCDTYYGFCEFPGAAEPTYVEYVEEEVVYEVVEYVECIDDWDCYSDEYCYENYCYVDAECIDDYDCGSYEECSEGECVSVVECFRDEHCYAGEFCGVDGFCYQFDSQCSSSYDCPDNTVCELGRCVVPYTTYSCWNNLDCPPGFNVCVDVVCPAGETECPGICEW